MQQNNTKNSVFIATSLDGFIADKNGGIDFLNSVPNPQQKDLGYNAFIERVDAIVMGRGTFDKVLSFNIPWPYKIPVFVLSSSLHTVAGELKDKVFVLNGTIQEILSEIHSKGFFRLYIDGGKVIQGFLREDLIDELILTTLPILLGEGISLFGRLQQPLLFELKKSEIFLETVKQDTYQRVVES